MFNHRVITLAALAVILAGAVHAADSSLIGWWKFDEGAGATAFDSSGNGNHGALQGSATLDTEGFLRGSVLLDGDGDYVDCGSSTVFNVGSAVTLAAWVRADPDFTYPDWSGIIMRGGPNIDTFALYYNRPNQQLGFKTTGAPPEWTATATNAAAALFDGEWHHTAATYDGQTKTIYLDGAAVITAAASGQIESSNGRLLLGAGRDLTPPTHLLVGRLDDARIYNRALSAAELAGVMEGTYDPIAENPSPADGATDIVRDVVLSWTPGEFARTHDVYLGTVFDDVNEASRANPMGLLVSQGQDANTYDPPGLLDIGQTYYWRVDEVNGAPDFAIYKGATWTFATEPMAYPIEGVVATSNVPATEGAGPENTVNGSGLDENDRHSLTDRDMWLTAPGAAGPVWIQYEFDRVYKLHELWVWNYNVQFEAVLGFGLRQVLVEYSTDGVEWTALGEVEFAKGPSTANYAHNTTVDLGGAAARFVRLTAVSGWGILGQYGLSEVRFFYVPVQARQPEPADGATEVNPNVALRWRAGREAAAHELYFSSDEAAVADGTALIDTIGQADYDLGALTFGTTYYWKVDEVNEAATPAVWAGPLWSFSTQEYVTIDDFEDYTDDLDAGEAIFQTWIDGWENGTGALVGYLDAPFAERGIVHGGRQSMPLAYDNAASPWYSEATRTFATAQDWTVNGADTLVLHVRGSAPAFFESSAGEIIISAVGTDIWGNADQFRYVYKSLSGNGSITVRVDSLVRSNEWAKAGVMIRETLEAGSKHAFVAVTPEPAHGISFQRRPIAGTTSYNTDAAGIEMPHWVKLTRTGNIFTAQQSADGVTWVDITPTAPVEILMAGNVYIGLAVTSHEAAISTTAEFSNVSTTGNVTGSWQASGIGAAQPEGNAPQPLYVTLEDSTGTTATVTHPDAAATARPTWQQWRIPLNAFDGVNLTRVETMAIGVGNRANPTAGGAGLIYIDDVQFGHPSDVE
ncbi:LamG-like jellyroll fold domain-containing protein [Anaerobaca lacustris]|uniref:Discoidin domain-containing protein n=1 Tax=Anaerobaca lacustris TaxID=3044600 RepID=A0AAW6TST7_9BACT|nr:discoidin domain-containing protein [Sedimentisphaerales bacterium M17dextr]